jgi:hypothetical protein
METVKRLPRNYGAKFQELGNSGDLLLVPRPLFLLMYDLVKVGIGLWDHFYFLVALVSPFKKQGVDTFLFSFFLRFAECGFILAVLV